MSTASAPVPVCFPGSLAFARSALLAACLALGLSQTALASTPEAVHFVVNAPRLSSALIQLSKQSGLSIVFSDRVTRDLPARELVGHFTPAAALDQLLAGTGLAWELIDNKVIAVYAAGCGDACPDARELLDRYPVYVPGLEETYVYGNRVTGSRIRRATYTGGAPVDVLAGPEIELSGAQSLGELLKFVPAVSGNATSTAISNGGDGTATVTLRGLPANNTLVLINGRRVASDGLAGDAVDLNSIPPAAVERIEILKDSASAIYGSDAIAGVVNVIMKRDFHGFLAETYYGETERGDLQTTTQTLQYGTGLPEGSLFLSASLYQQDPIFSRDRDVSRNADTRAEGGADQRSSATPDARISLPDGRTVIATADGYRPATDEDLFNYQAFTTAVVPFERTSLYGSASYDFAQWLTGEIELSYTETDAEAVLAPTPVFTAFEQDPLLVAADNIYNDFEVDLADVRRRLVEFPERRQRNESEVARMAAALQGLWADWSWDFGYNWSRSEATEASSAIVNADHLRRAIGPAAGCQGPPLDDCVPVNLLGPAGTLEPAQADYIMATGQVSGYSELYSAGFSMSRAVDGLPAGRADVAFGFEHRRESTRKRPGPLLASTSTIGATNFDATRGKRTVAEFFLESVVPLWKSADGLAKLDLEAALRYSDYSDFGTTTNPKVALRYSPGPALLLRANYAGGFRAPSLNELYEGVTENQAFLLDPCTQPANVGVLPGCTALGDPSRNQFLTLEGGNPQLQPETSESYSVGLVLTPARLQGLALSADFFRIEQQDVVSSSAQYIVDQNARFGSFEDRVERDAMGNLVLVRASNLNIGERRVSGADFGLDWRFAENRFGQFTLNGSTSWIAEYLAQQDASAPREDLAGSFRDEASEGLGGIPEWKAQLGLRWNRERWRGSYQVHYVDSMRERVPDSDRWRNIKAWMVHDVQLNYTFDVLDGLRLSLGVDNLFDEAAPLATSAFNDNIDGRTHELKGRFWYTRLSQRF
ncbi:TonB-dependent receptor [Mangrovimicrobium sediminis]|uniref:TonB-dependent receptor n=1 Tax=Mangrovimicrobium sediminis TaxID=2562682 RepID=A0A4Z0LZX3_9GAMM|nr:TonB-dependent receptor [Haliea sp. SAOS-164]TGD72963.1 TonB-dependent receptor [Haliea sp. SAOS-164]